MAGVCQVTLIFYCGMTAQGGTARQFSLKSIGQTVSVKEKPYVRFGIKLLKILESPVNITRSIMNE